MAPLDALKRQQKYLKRVQRGVSRKVKGSKNRRKAIDRLGKVHARIAAQRSDWLHKLTTRWANEHPVIAIEDLKVAAMSASAKGTATAPGKRVRQKAGLNRAILDQAWGEARRQLEYKTAARGGAVVAVNPAYTSQRCSACGHTAKENRLTQAHFECEVCGHSENADLNAAKNIRAAGHAVWVERPEACGVEVRRAGPERGRRAAARKQEPARRNATTAAPTAEQTTIELVGGANASEADDEAPAPVASSPAVRLPWPADLPEQMRAVADALSASAQPLDEDALAARFTGRGPWKKRLQQILETLVVLGKAQREPAGRWRGA